MDDLTLLKGLRSDRPAPGAGATADARARLLAEAAASARKPPRRFRWPVLGLVAATAAATAGILAVNAAGEGPLRSYSSSAMAAEQEGGKWHVEIKDAYAAPEEFAEGFAELGLKVDLILAPVSPERERRVLMLGRTDGRIRGGGPGFVIGDCPKGVRECPLSMTIDAPKDVGWKVVLGRKALEGEPYFDSGPQDRDPKEPVPGVRLNGRTVGEAVKALRERSFEPLFALRGASPDGPGWPYQVDPSWTPADSRRVLSAHAHDLKTVMLVLEPLPGDPARTATPDRGLIG